MKGSGSTMDKLDKLKKEITDGKLLIYLLFTNGDLYKLDENLKKIRIKRICNQNKIRKIVLSQGYFNLNKKLYLQNNEVIGFYQEIGFLDKK